MNFPPKGRARPGDWEATRGMIDLAEVAIRLLGPAPGRRGERGRRRWWRCPFHEDRNPSFCVEPGRPWWKCYGCGAHGGAVDLVRRLHPAMTFPEVTSYLTGGAPPPARPFGGPAPPPPRGPGSGPTVAPRAGPSGLPEAEARALVAEAPRRLWSPEGAEARAYLQGRGLAEETLRAARMGWTPGVMIPRGDGTGFRARGVVIPWFASGHLALAKIRQPAGRRPKYVEAHRDPGRLTGIYPGPEAIRPGRPLVIVEGELDALLLGQALGELAAVVTLGSASARPEPPIFGKMLAAAPWYVATDADPAGDRAAAGWPASARRVAPPGAFKDWTEAGQGGVDLRRWWSDRLGGIAAPPLFTWEDLVTWRWGPALGDPTPDISLETLEALEPPGRGGKEDP